MKLIFFFCK